MKLLMIALALGLAAARPDSVAPDTEFEVAAASTEVHSQALQELAAMKKKGVSDEACVTNAKKSIGDTCSEASNAQKSLNGLDKGSKCSEKGTQAIKDAKGRVLGAKLALKRAVEKLKNSRDKKICGTSPDQISKSSEWRKKQRDIAQKKEQVAAAKQGLRDREGEQKRDELAAKKAQRECRCKAFKNAKKELKIAQSETPKRSKALLREKILICLVKERKGGKSGSVCLKKKLTKNDSKCLALKITKLAPNVDEKSCIVGKIGGCPLNKVLVAGKMTKTKAEAACAKEGLKPVCEYKGGAYNGCKPCWHSSHWHNCGVPNAHKIVSGIGSTCGTRRDNGNNGVACTGPGNSKCNPGSWASSMKGTTGKNGQDQYILCTP